MFLRFFFFNDIFENIAETILFKWGFCQWLSVIWHVNGTWNMLSVSPCWGVRALQKREGGDILGMTLHLMLRLHFWRSEECGIHFIAITSRSTRDALSVPRSKSAFQVLQFYFLPVDLDSWLILTTCQPV